MVQFRGNPVAYVHAGPVHASANQALAHAFVDFGTEVEPHKLGEFRRVFRMVHEQPQAGSRLAERPRHVNRVAGLCGTAEERSRGHLFAQERRREHADIARNRIAANQRNPALRKAFRYRLRHAVAHFCAPALVHAQAKQRKARAASHGRDVRDVRDDMLFHRLLRRRPVEAEMRPFHGEVLGHEPPVKDGAVVTDGEPPPKLGRTFGQGDAIFEDFRDKIEFAEVWKHV